MAKYTNAQFEEAAKKAIDDNMDSGKITDYTIDGNMLNVVVRSNSGKTDHGFTFFMQDDGSVTRSIAGYPGENMIYRIGHSLIQHLAEFD